MSFIKSLSKHINVLRKYAKMFDEFLKTIITGLHKWELLKVIYDATFLFGY